MRTRVLNPRTHVKLNLVWNTYNPCGIRTDDGGGDVSGWIPGIRPWRPVSGYRRKGSIWVYYTVHTLIHSVWANPKTPKSSANHITPHRHHVPKKTLLFQMSYSEGEGVGCGSIRISVKSGKPASLVYYQYLYKILLCLLDFLYSHYPMDGQTTYLSHPSSSWSILGPSISPDTFNSPSLH